MNYLFKINDKVRFIKKPDSLPKYGWVVCELSEDYICKNCLIKHPEHDFTMSAKEEELLHEDNILEDTIPERYSSRLVNGMDVIALSEFWGFNPQEMNILKYLLRDKGEDLSDMNKISDYALREAELIKNRVNGKKK